MDAETSVLSVSAVEAVPLEDLDLARAQAALVESETALSAAGDDAYKMAEAQIAVDTNMSIVDALGGNK